MSPLASVTRRPSTWFTSATCPSSAKNAASASRPEASSASSRLLRAVSKFCSLSLAV